MRDEGGRMRNRGVGSGEDENKGKRNGEKRNRLL
jgi:hypothetical protein